jgi:hypothetical protein
VRGATEMTTFSSPTAFLRAPDSALRLGFPVQRDRLENRCGPYTVDASSGQQRRHRLNRHGNRELNSALHKIAVVQGRCEPRARAYLERRQAEGKTRREALRCLKRHLVRVVFRLLRQADGGRRELVLKVRGGKVRVPALT